MKEPLKKWQYLPIYEYKFKKFGIFQPDTAQPKTEAVTVDDALIPRGPAHKNTLVMNKDRIDHSENVLA